MNDPLSILAPSTKQAGFCTPLGQREEEGEIRKFAEERREKRRGGIGGGFMELLLYTVRILAF